MLTNVRNRIEKINLEELLVANLSLAPHSSIGTGGKADLAAYPTDFEEIRALLYYAKDHKLPITVLAGMTNSLISDQGIPGLTIITTHLTRQHVQGEMLAVRSGIIFDHVIDLALEAGLSGLEMLAGIPGTVGGAVYGNAGAHGAATADLLSYIDYMTFDGKLHRLQANSDEFSYRRSPFLGRKDVILYELGFRLTPTLHSSEGKKLKNEVKHARHAKGYNDNPSLGSTFRNPPGEHAGELLQRCNLQGTSVGGAMVSKRHCNFIINANGKATSADIYTLMMLMRQRVQEQTGILLQPEIQLIGRW